MNEQQNLLKETTEQNFKNLFYDKKYTRMDAKTTAYKMLKNRIDENNEIIINGQKIKYDEKTVMDVLKNTKKLNKD